MSQPITISTLTSHIAQLLEQDNRLRDLWVTGEVSNWKRAASGHIYFSIKDSGATITAVMWRNSAQAHSWLPDNGDQIIAHGYVGVYPERGVYQLYANRIQPAGRGQLYAQFEALKERLAAAGLFAPERKRPIARQPQRIALVTSASGAALRDILNVLTARWPLVQVLLFPTLVQGAEAPGQIVRALSNANEYSNNIATIDTVLVARGGGSIEDLWAFNDEHVAQTIVESTIPVITGVGHETDFTIADFVADLRAPTPSAAAAAAVPDQQDTLVHLQRLRNELLVGSLRRLAQEEQSLQQLQHRLRRISPQRQLDQRRQQLDDCNSRLQSWFVHGLRHRRLELHALRARLQALNPQGVLQRGYSIVQKADGSVVTDPATVAAGEQLRIQAAAGTYTVTRQ